MDAPNSSHRDAIPTVRSVRGAPLICGRRLALQTAFILNSEI